MALPVAARDAIARRLIYAALSWAYGNAPTLQQSEEMAPTPPIFWKSPAKLVAM
jgi:hypothetical protein